MLGLKLNHVSKRGHRKLWTTQEMLRWFKICMYFKHSLLIGILRISRQITVRWMPQDVTDYRSTLVQVMAWYKRAIGGAHNHDNPCSPLQLFIDIKSPLGYCTHIILYVNKVTKQALTSCLVTRVAARIGIPWPSFTHLAARNRAHPCY